MHFFAHLTELVLAKDAHISKRRNRVSYTKLYILPYHVTRESIREKRYYTYPHTIQYMFRLEYV